jgi:hypothetical protein
MDLSAVTTDVSSTVPIPPVPAPDISNATPNPHPSVIYQHHHYYYILPKSLPPSVDTSSSVLPHLHPTALYGATKYLQGPDVSAGEFAGSPWPWWSETYDPSHTDFIPPSSSDIVGPPPPLPTPTPYGYYDASHQFHHPILHPLYPSYLYPYYFPYYQHSPTLPDTPVDSWDNYDVSCVTYDISSDHFHLHSTVKMWTPYPDISYTVPLRRRYSVAWDINDFDGNF